MLKIDYCRLNDYFYFRTNSGYETLPDIHIFAAESKRFRSELCIHESCCLRKQM